MCMCNTGSNDWLESSTVQPREQVRPHMRQYCGQVLRWDSTIRSHCKSMLTVIRFYYLHTCLWCLWTVIELVCKQKQGLLLTIAVGKMEAMAACCGRSWMVSRRRAGYMPSPRDMWLTACNRESKSTVNATSSSPSIMFLVVVHHNWPPAWEENIITAAFRHEFKKCKCFTCKTELNRVVWSYLWCI